MNQRVTAVYANGVLKPLIPLDLEEEQLVSLSIEKLAENGRNLSDNDYLPLIAAEGDPNVTWEEVQAVLAKLPSSLDEEFDRDRDERS